MARYKLIQLTNKNVTQASFLPLGDISRRVDTKQDCPTFTVSYSGADTVTITSPGYYKITYNLSATVSTTDDITLSLVGNSTSLYSVTTTPAAADSTVNTLMTYIIRVYPECNCPQTNNPMRIQFTASGNTITAGESNLIVERVY